MHVKAPLAAGNGRERSRSKATKSDVFDLGEGQTTTPGTPCPTLYEWCVGSLTSHSYFATRVMRRNLRLIVLIREDLKVLPFADVITKAALSTHLF